MRSNSCLIFLPLVVVLAQAPKSSAPKPTRPSVTQPATKGVPAPKATMPNPAPTTILLPPTDFYGNVYLKDAEKTLYLLFNESLYRSLSATGDSWGRVTEGVRFAAMDPKNPQLIYTVNSQGLVMKSADGGKSWLNLNNGLPPGTARLLTINPTNPQECFVGTESGLYRTTDGGFGWSPTALAGRIRQHLISSNGRTAYSLTSAGLFVSSDGSQTWQRVDTALPGVLVREGRTASAVPPTIDQILVIGDTAVLAFTAEKGLFRSNDLGKTWSDANAGLPPGSRFYSAYAGPDDFLIGSSSGIVYRSIDGRSWTALALSGSAVTLGPLIGAFRKDGQPGIYLADLRQRQGKTLAYLEPSGRLIGLNYGILSHSDVRAILRTVVDGKGALMAVVINRGYVDSYFNRAGDLRSLEQGGQGLNHIVLSTDNGLTWLPVLACDCTGSLVETSRPLMTGPASDLSELLIAEPQHSFQLLRTRDGGRTWSRVSNSPEGINSIAFDPADKTLVYLVAGDRYASGAHIYRARIDPLSSQAQVVNLGPSGSSVVSLRNNLLFTSNGRISNDGGLSWSDKSNAFRAAKLESPINLIYSAGEDMVVYTSERERISLSQRGFTIARSVGLGDSWEIVYRSKDDELYWIRAERDEPRHLFLAERVDVPGQNRRRTSAVRLDESRDGGRTWETRFSVPYVGEQGWLVRDATSVQTPAGQILYVAGRVGLRRSIDGGATWEQVGGIR